MSRRRVVAKRKTLPDSKFNDLLMGKFVNILMNMGRKSVAEKLLYGAMDIISEKTNENPLQKVKSAVENVKPMLEVKSRRVGGSTYQIPVEVRSDRRQSLSIRWLIEGARKRPELSMTKKLAGEIMDAANKTGTAIKKREETHKMAEANKAFAHYRW